METIAESMAAHLKDMKVEDATAASCVMKFIPWVIFAASLLMKNTENVFNFRPVISKRILPDFRLLLLMCVTLCCGGLMSWTESLITMASSQWCLTNNLISNNWKAVVVFNLNLLQRSELEQGAVSVWCRQQEDVLPNDGYCRPECCQRVPSP